MRAGLLAALLAVGGGGARAGGEGWEAGAVLVGAKARLAAGAELVERGGGCWEAALAAAPGACSAPPFQSGAAVEASLLTAPGRTRLAVELTRCHLSTSGLPVGGPCPAWRDADDCVKDLTGEDARAFHAYTEFFLGSLDLCFHVRHGSFEALLAKTVARLGQGTADAFEALQSVQKGVEGLTEGQVELVQGQRRLRDAGAAAAEAIERRQEATRAEVERLGESAQAALQRNAKGLELNAARLRGLAAEAAVLGEAQRELLDASRALEERVNRTLTGLLSELSVWDLGFYVMLVLFWLPSFGSGGIGAWYAVVATAVFTFAHRSTPVVSASVAAAVIHFLQYRRMPDAAPTLPPALAGDILPRLDAAILEIRQAQEAGGRCCAAVSKDIRDFLEELRQREDSPEPCPPRSARRRPRRSARRVPL